MSTQPTPPQMQQPTSAPVIKVMLGGQERTLLMGFRAWKKLNLNPFKADDIQNYMKDLDIDKAAAFIQAGMENASVVLKLEAPPTLDETIDMLDVFSFNAVMAAINNSVRTVPAVKADGVDPQPAQTGSPSGPSVVN